MPAMTDELPAQRDAAGEFGDETERIKLEENVVAEEAIDIESGRFRIEFDPRAKLHGVRRDREIRLDLEARIVVREQADPDARHVAEAVRQRRNGRNVAEVRMESADAERKSVCASPHETRNAMLPVIE